jgi:hypothetical protein
LGKTSLADKPLIFLRRDTKFAGRGSLSPIPG